MKIVSRSLCLSLIASAALSAVAAENILVNEDFNSSSSLDKWTENENVTIAEKEGLNSTNCLKITGQEGSGSMISLKLDPARYAGKTIRIDAMIKGNKISNPGKAWLGPKLMIYTKTASGEEVYQDQTGKKYGDFDWTICSNERSIPKNTEIIEVFVGIQDGSGTLYLDDFKIVELEKK